MTHRPGDDLFDPQSCDSSIWHGLPMGTHAIGLLHEVRLEKDRPILHVATDDDGMQWSPAQHWPALAWSTVYTIVLDAVNVWFESKDGRIGRHDFRRTDLHWTPASLRATWQAGDVTIELEGMMVDGDRARIRATVSSRTLTPGSLVVAGDRNACNCTCRGQEWATATSRLLRLDAGQVLSARHVRWGLMPDFFPYIMTLPPADRQFEWIDMHFLTAAAILDTALPWKVIEVPLPQDSASWRWEAPARLDAESPVTVELLLAGKWLGRDPSADADAKRWGAGLSAECAPATLTIVNRNRALFQDWLARVPAPASHWPDHLRRLYHKAWISVLYNTVPALDMILHRSRHAMGTCNKIGLSTMTTCPATWENALSAMVWALVDPPTAWDLLRGIFQTMTDDGYIGELPGLPRSTALPCVEPLAAWTCYRLDNPVSGRDALASLYPAMKLNFLYKAHHPTWKHHAPMMVRNFAYAAIAADYLLKIATVLNRPTEEIDVYRTAGRQLRMGVHAYWNPEGGYYRANFVPALGKGLADGVFDEGTDAEALIPLFRVARPDVMPRLLETLRRHFVTDNGVITRKPRGLPSGTSGHFNQPGAQSDFSIKESNQMVLAKAIKDLDAALFDRIARGTLDNIARVDDFYECYTTAGVGKHNGPGGIFGAFAVIWLMLLHDGVVDRCYESDLPVQ